MSTPRRLLRFAIAAPMILAAGEATFLLPYVASLRFFHPVRTAYMWQRPGSVTLAWRPLEKMAPALRESVVTAEDANFTVHHGLDFREMESSWKKNRRKKKYARGFSTITMQLARNLFLTPRKNLLRKALEIGIALEMELVLPKNRILELYLNLIEWGEGVYGAEAASQYYFKTSAASLSPEQAVFLASIIPSPRKWGRWPPGPCIRRRMNVMMTAMRSVKKEPLEMPEETDGEDTDAPREEESQDPP